jgi:hypothetical protein
MSLFFASDRCWLRFVDSVAETLHWGVTDEIDDGPSSQPKYVDPLRMSNFFFSSVDGGYRSGMDASGIVVRDPVLVVGVAPDGLIDGLCLVWILSMDQYVASTYRLIVAKLREGRKLTA